MIAIMSDDFFRKLAELPGKTVHIRRNGQVFERGDAVHAFHRVVSGEVHLLRRQIDGAAFILQRAGPGDILAEASLNTPRYHCAAEAVADSKLQLWPASSVRRLLETDGRATEGYARHLASQLRRERMRAEILSLRRVSERLDAWLTWHDGAMPEKGQMVQLAHDLNVSAEALYREMARRRGANGQPTGD